MPKMTNRFRKRFTLSVERVARKTTLKNKVGKAQERISSLNVMGLKTHWTTIRTPKHKNHHITPHHLIPSPHQRRTIQKINFATTPKQRSYISPTTVRSDPSTKIFHQNQQQLLVYPSVAWQQQMGKATLFTYNNTHLYQKPIPTRDSDHTASFTT